MVYCIGVNGYKVGAHDLKVVIVDTEKECGIDRCVDDTKEIFLAL
jgi:hypothetical protein